MNHGSDLSLDTETAAARFRVIGHPSRLEILRFTGDRERTVGEIAETVGLTQPVTSQHLRSLRDAGLVRVRRVGNRRLYRTDPDEIARIRMHLDALWPTALADLKRAAEAHAGTTE